MLKGKKKAPPSGVDEKVYEIYRHLEPRPKELIEPAKKPRIFIREGPVYQWRPKQKIVKKKYLHLFSDMLVVSRKVNKKSFVTKIVMRLGPTKSLKSALVSNSSYYIKGVEFRVWNKNHMFVFFGTTPTTALSWVRDLVYTMRGGRLPYKPMVNPETGEEYDAEGERKDQELLRRMQELRQEDKAPQTGILNVGKDLLGDDDWSGFEGGPVLQPVKSMDPSILVPEEDDDKEATAAGNVPRSQSEVVGAGSGASAEAGEEEAGDSKKNRHSMLPYNPFLTVGSNPFDPFGSEESERRGGDAAAGVGTSAQDWATLVEKAVVEVSMVGKNAILDLEQMRNLDKSLVDDKTYSQAKSNKAGFEKLFAECKPLIEATDAAARQTEAEKLAASATAALPAIKGFSEIAVSNVENVSDDFARGRQRYLFQGLAKAIRDLESLLRSSQPVEEGAAEADAAEEGPSEVEVALNKIITSVEESVSALTPDDKEEHVIQAKTIQYGGLLAELLRAATAAQKSLGEAAKKKGVVYHRDPAWEDGLVSAAKSVLHNANLLMNASVKVEEAGTDDKEFECDALVASVRSMNGTVARLVLSARVKVDPESEEAKRLENAAAEVKQTACHLETLTIEEALKSREQPIESDSKEAVGGVSGQAQKIDAMSKVARLERELEEARQMLGKLNSEDYQKK
mmetsp:Transcript_19323/g.54257  ORF Transcript_19323/g.54257 Transcript_19323/m.54257 type:complete len:682 (-) Transcript_19323:45-2090(-)|eukprot:CAMPEP_0119127008 /NCGR_PEP_ID=MMETSP1310-20130426/5711_1 /TAXON_ID=464262 /ORGANISM="Genus nov. species nov., Strain RCC2339" /LENGTH=681 /DNA_ID=CAMNT_0007117219 /DNA_START=48 /DNA_END=2093 /DNA_ORIENTATION=-